MARHSTCATSPHALASHQLWLSHVPLKVNNASYDHLVHPCSQLWNNHCPCLLSIRLHPRWGQTLSFDWPTLPTSCPLHLPPLLPHLCPQQPASITPSHPPTLWNCRHSHPPRLHPQLAADAPSGNTIAMLRGDQCLRNVLTCMLDKLNVCVPYTLCCDG